MDNGTIFQAVKPLVNPAYAYLDEISRCVHFDDFKEAVLKEMLVPQRVTNGRTKLRCRVLWFAPSHSSSDHNFFGNVSFTIKWETVLQKLGPNLYFIDQAVFNSRSCTRVLLTRKKYHGRFRKVDLNSFHSPLQNCRPGFIYVSHCMNKVRNGPHVLEIAIEVNDADARWFYLNCRQVANNHTEANPHVGNARTYGPESIIQGNKCFKFNAAQNLVCPYQWTVAECEKKIDAVFQSTGSATEIGRKKSVSRKKTVSRKKSVSRKKNISNSDSINYDLNSSYSYSSLSVHTGYESAGDEWSEYAWPTYERSIYPARVAAPPEKKNGWGWSILTAAAAVAGVWFVIRRISK
ncbi:uncharacterized protein LOC108665550 isoform X2 [Hyalella azteca]|uniref:Uncharacterized protein LOC108665550 isoform X2 n=1 Tax=Hyalella azteca TaxID=294128 RepID=A0A8B7N3J1_HYAAZ|nr:uncharacterized protein LOC108665550 isoform X2 [Hyalella azteca]